MRAETMEIIINAVDRLDDNYDIAECYRAILQYISGIENNEYNINENAQAMFDLAKVIIDMEKENEIPVNMESEE